MLPTKLGPDFYALIERWEGLRLQAYLDTEGVPTIGYGTTSASGIPVKMGDVITREQARQYLEKTAVRYADAIRKYVKVPLNQPQFDALVSWCYNVGPANVARSTLVKLLNRHDYDSVPAQLMRWTHSSSGNARRGLTNRRAAEAAVFTRGTAMMSTTPVALTSLKPECPDKTVTESTQVQAVAVGAASTTTLAFGELMNLKDFIPLAEGAMKTVLLAVILLSLAWILWRRLKKDQPALTP